MNLIFSIYFKAIDRLIDLVSPIDYNSYLSGNEFENIVINGYRNYLFLLDVLLSTSLSLISTIGLTPEAAHLHIRRGEEG